MHLEIKNNEISKEQFTRKNSVNYIKKHSNSFKKSTDEKTIFERKNSSKYNQNTDNITIFMTSITKDNSENNISKNLQNSEEFE